MNKTKREKGNFAEDLACFFLKNKGFTVTERNFWGKHGEIDIVTYETKLFKKPVLTFFEVKSVSCENVDECKNKIAPEEHMNEEKFKKLQLTIKEYLNTRKIKEKNFKLKLITVKFSEKEKSARFKIYDLY